MRQISLSFDELKRLLDYNPETGFFTWKVARSNRIKVGERAGVFHPASGGRYISVGDEKFMAHRLAWFYVKGEWPKNDIRPENGDYDDCRIDNLREMTRVELSHLRDKTKNNTSGYRGVSACKGKGTWQAAITWNYKQISLGANFKTPEEANEVYQDAAKLFAESTFDNLDDVRTKLLLLKRQRAIWLHFQRWNIPTSWQSFEEFRSDITEVPESRYAMVAKDPMLPLGPDNYSWSLPIDSTIKSTDCIVTYNKARRHANPDHYRAKHLKKEYGADLGYERKLREDQKGCCAICQRPEPFLIDGQYYGLSLDHDHKTGALRSLLCKSCNLGLGYLCDDPDLIRRAAAYIDRHRGEALSPEHLKP